MNHIFGLWLNDFSSTVSITCCKNFQLFSYLSRISHNHQKLDRTHDLLCLVMISPILLMTNERDAIGLLMGSSRINLA